MVSANINKSLESILHYIYCKFDRECCKLVIQEDLEKEAKENPESQFYGK